MQFHGTITALITPFKNGKVDEKAFQDFVEWQIKEGVHGVVPCGTTGESPTLSHEEHHRVVKLCVEVVAGRRPVIAGAGSNSTDEAVDFANGAKKSGADALLIVTPYYNKPTEEGLYQHFKALNAVGLPIILYNIPGRSVINMSDAFIAKLAKDLPNIVGLKDATGDLARPSRLRMFAGTKFTQLSGEDVTALAFNALGGVGCISVTSNIVPGALSKMQDLWAAGKTAEALALHDSLMPLHEAMFCETNPMPVKYAAHLLGKCGDDIRLPLVMPREESRKRVEKVMQDLKLI